MTGREYMEQLKARSAARMAQRAAERAAMPAPAKPEPAPVVERCQGMPAVGIGQSLYCGGCARHIVMAYAPANVVWLRGPIRQREDGSCEQRVAMVAA